MTAREEAERETARALLLRWAPDPVAFAHECLGLRTWSRQRDMLMAGVTHSRVAVRSGHRTTKTTTAAILVLHNAICRPRGRSILTAPSYRQVADVLYKECVRLHSESLFPLGGVVHETPERGIQFAGGREVIGFSTREPERFAGFAGPNMLFVPDESSGIHDEIHEAIAGNRAGNARIFMPSNPTQTSGVFFDAFNDPRSLWHKMHVSSLEAAQLAAAELGPDTGVATQEWCDECLQEWGPEDPRYQVRVLGNFPSQDSNAMVAKAIVDAAVRRWRKDASGGALQIGVDVARFGPDTSSIIPRRDLWVGPTTRKKGNDNVEVARAVVEVIREHRRYPTEPVKVCIDTSNNGGVADILNHGPDQNIEVIEMVASASSPVPQYSRLRDYVWACGRDFMKELGGSCPPDKRLEADLVAPRMGFDERGRIKVESKKEMRKRLGRSTDDGDAFCLAVYPTGGNDALAAQILDDQYRGSASRTI